MRGLVVIGHDGSNMPHLANNVCTCAAVFYCSHTNQYVNITWLEKSTKKAVNNYRDEILGGVQYTADHYGSNHWAQCDGSWSSHCGVQ